MSESARPGGAPPEPSNEVATPFCTYDVDADLRLEAVDEGWIRFAVENGAPRLLPPACLGRSLLAGISDPTTGHLYRALFDKVRTSGEPVTVGIRCDSPTMRRWLELRIEPAGRGFRVRTTLTKAERRAPQDLLLAHGTTDGTLLRMCGWCNQVHAGDEWLEVEEAVRRLGLFEGHAHPGVTHGICGVCLDKVSAAIEDEGGHRREMPEV